MSKSKIILGCTALSGTGKKGVIPVDKDGYRTVVLGALDVFNSAGEFYASNEAARSHFQPNSILQRRLTTGACRGEIMHPPKLPGMTQAEWSQRLLEIYPDKVSHHHKEIWLDSKFTKLQNGKPVTLIMGKVKPAGPYAESLETSLDNPEENTAFSIRAFSSIAMVGGNVEKTLRNVICFDHVNEPGIEFATKYQNPTLEGLCSDIIITPEMLDGIASGRSAGGISLEGSSSIEMIKTDLGWNSTEVINPNALGSMKW